MVLPEPFSTASPTLVNFTFSEVIEGTGSIVYYVGEALDNAASAVYPLNSKTFFSNDIEEEIISNASGTFALTLERNYDSSPIILSQNIAGAALCSLGWFIKGHASTTITGYVIVKLIRVRGGAGGTEVIIGTGKTGEIAKATAFYETRMTALSLSLTDTHIIKGDILRVSIEGWTKSGGGGLQGFIGWGSDPKNRDGANLTAAGGDRTDTHVIVPFKTNA